MKISSYLENHQRGTPDFPMELYIVTENHPHYHMQFHWHSDIEIVHVSEGMLYLTLNDVRYELKENDSIIIPGGIVHGATPQECKYECLVFSKSLLYVAPEIKKLIKTKFVYPVRFEANSRISSLFESIMENENEKLTHISMLFEIMSETLKKQDGSIVLSEEKIERIKPAIVYVEDNYAAHISVGDLAKECLMSNNYFIRYFKEVTGQTPIEFLNKYRLEVACEMLISGGSVTETAFACGFNDLSYFIHIFKKELGVSPKKYSGKN